MKRGWMIHATGEIELHSFRSRSIQLGEAGGYRTLRIFKMEKPDSDFIETLQVARVYFEKMKFLKFLSQSAHENPSREVDFLKTPSLYFCRFLSHTLCYSLCACAHIIKELGVRDKPMSDILLLASENSA